MFWYFLFYGMLIVDVDYFSQKQALIN